MKHVSCCLEVWPSGLRRNFAKVEGAKALRRFESCHFRMENTTEKPFKLHPETYRNTLESSKDTAEILRESVELLERSIAASEELEKSPGLVLVDDDGNVLKEIKLKGLDTQSLRERLDRERVRLSSVENFIQELVDENEEDVV